MKITSVDIMELKPVKGGMPFPTPVIIRVNTDAGISGLGEVGISVGFGVRANFGIMEDLCPRLLGRDPFDNEVVWEEIRTTCFGHISGAGVVVYNSLSAMDMALMDIKGKALGVPVYVLLGGKARTRIPAYVSHAEHGWIGSYTEKGSPGDYAEITKVIADDGFKAAKYDLFFQDENIKPIPREDVAGPVSAGMLRMFEKRLAAIRKAGGDDFGIMLDMFCKPNLATAAALDGIMRDYGVLFAEEMLPPYNTDVAIELARRIKTPIALGEKVRTRWEYRPYIENNAVAVIEPDLTNCGGISEGKKICDMAHMYDIKAQMHTCGSPVSQAAALQVEAAIPNLFMHEELFFDPEPELKGLCRRSCVAEHGFIEVCDEPGIGQELTEETINSAVRIVTIRE